MAKRIAVQCRGAVIWAEELKWQHRDWVLYEHCEKIFRPQIAHGSDLIRWPVEIATKARIIETIGRL